MRTPDRVRRYYIFMQTSICRRITILSAAHFRPSGAFQHTRVPQATFWRTCVVLDQIGLQVDSFQARPGKIGPP